MKVKAGIFIIGVLILAQIVLYNHAQKKNGEHIDQKTIALQGQIRGFEMEKIQLQRRLQGLQAVIESLPPSILKGFEDPEKGFVKFLDYLQSPHLKRVDGKISLAKAQTFKETPVPLHKTDFGIKFSFLKTYDAEKFLNHVLEQTRYPLQVQEFSVKRTKGGKANGNLKVALLIPAKLDLQALISQLSQKSEGK